MQPLKITRTNTILYCDRWNATVGFYRDVVKLPVLMEKTWFTEFQLTGSGCLSVVDATHASIRSAHGAGITMSWRVENIDAVHACMVAEHIDVTPIKITWGARTFFLFDPEGNRIELWA
jgi:predicted enzyme related to lactoylglutathione lyase